MRRPVLEEWSRGDSWLHCADPRSKLIAVLVVLVFLGTSRARPAQLAAEYLPVILLGLGGSGLPPWGVTKRVLAVMTFSAAFSAAAWIAGQPERAGLLLTKSALSSYAILLFAGTTPLPGILRSLEWLGAPRLLVQTTQFLYRYLFVLVAKARQMRAAALCRGGFRWESAGGAAAALFGSAYGRAEGSHRAMLSRGAAGHIASPPWQRPEAASVGLPCALALYLTGARLLWNL